MDGHSMSYNHEVSPWLSVIVLGLGVLMAVYAMYELKRIEGTAFDAINARQSVIEEETRRR